jgi:hypothetical protein
MEFSGPGNSEIVLRQPIHYVRIDFGLFQYREEASSGLHIRLPDGIQVRHRVRVKHYSGHTIPYRVLNPQSPKVPISSVYVKSVALPDPTDA